MLTLSLPKEVENLLIQTAQEEQISQAELIEKALQRYAHAQRIQNYKNDIELLEQGKLKTYTGDEVFGAIKKRLKEKREKRA